MNYVQVIAPLPSNAVDTEILIAQLAEIGFESFEETKSDVVAYIPERDFDKDKLLSIDYCSLTNKKGNLIINKIADKNWNEVWESNYPSVTIANKCYIRAAFHKSNPDIDYEIVITPKMAFGTAHHETTSLMIQLILDNNFKDKNVLDMGCGTGVLSILASMVEAKNITAIDIDSWSYDSTIENAAINNISNIKAFEGGAELLTDTDNFDIIFANINKNILMRDMKSYANSLLVNGHIYFSGFYLSDLDDIKNNAKKNGLRFVSNLEKNNWVAAVFIKQ